MRAAARTHPLGRLECALLALTAATGLVAGRMYPVWRQSVELLCPAWTIFGIPCPTCGGTRAVAAVAQGDLLGALSWNPLVAALTIGAVAIVPLAAAASLGWLPVPRVPQRLGRWTRACAALALALNWLYLLRYFAG